jgi:endo-1,3-1,4-beta-glycanase ExoK
MKLVRNGSLLAVLLLMLFAGACSTWSGGADRTLRGRVVDPANAPVAGVEVHAPGCAPTMTGANGEFTVARVPAVERFAVTFRAPRFIETTRVYDTRRVATDIVVVWPRSQAQPLNAVRGGTLNFPAGTVTIPPRALVDGGGQPIDGDVRVSFSAFDVTDPRQYRNAPGDFTARMRDGSIRQLETFGVFEVYVEDARGRRADLRRGTLAEVELGVPERLRPPKTVGSYSFEAASGLWVEEATFQLTRPRRLQGAIRTLSLAWNADDLLNTTCIVITADCSCAAVDTTSLSVTGQGLDYAHSFTAGKGDCVNVKTGAKLLLTPSIATMLPVEITTPTETAKCFQSPCPQTVTFRCPRQTSVMAGLTSCTTDPDWQCSSYPPTDSAFDTIWKGSQQISFSGGAMTLGIDPCTTACNGEQYDSGELQSTCYYGYGLYEAKIQAANAAGTVTTFFVYTGPGDSTRHDEIDIEIFGRPGTEKGCSSGSAAQATWFVNGQRFEQTVCLGFDATAGARWFAFDWQPTVITWYADKDGDGTIQSTEVLHQTLPTDLIPSQPGKIIANLWAGVTTDSNVTNWMGTFMYNSSNPPRAIYEAIRYTP